jgi:mannose/cellobiose epimerase-like protein (N-acyl-D-glucosamine 2-epimerase family)
LNRATGLAYGAVSRHGLPLDTNSRSWPQTEAVKAAMALDGNGGPDLKPEVEARVGRLFRWHIEPAPKGLWIDLIDETGRAKAEDVPASIFYHLVCALTQYVDYVGKKPQ